MAADRWDDQVGSVADEAARLLESLLRASDGEGDGEGDREAGRERGDDAGDEADDEGDDDAGHGTGHDPFCQWCPLCRSAAVVRSLSPETLSRLSDLAAVAAGVLADLAARASASPHRTEPGDPPAPPRARPVPVVDIDVSEEGPHV